MIKEELNKLPNPWIRIGVRPNTSQYCYGKTEMYLIEHSENYHGCMANCSKGSHYHLGLLSTDAENGYTIIING